MKIIRSATLDYVPASHEDPKNPGSLKKVLFKRQDFEGRQTQMINWSVLPAGKSFSAHYHEDMEEVFIVLSGEPELVVDGQSTKLTAGDAVLIPMRATHVMHNSSEREVEYIVIGITSDGAGKTVLVSEK